MVLKSNIYICLLVTVVADWVKLPALDPRKDVSSVPAIPYLKDSLNILKYNTYPLSTRESSSIPIEAGLNSANVVENKSIQGVRGQNNNASHQKEHFMNMSMLSENGEIDSNFLLSIMNNSQKVDRVGLENTHNERKVNPFFEILKNVHNTLLKGTPTSILGKIKYLQKLQMNLYSYIKPRIKRLWMAEDRQARTEKGMGMGMGFPSMDGALMTISFLLFAVFLIKLVKQLIQQLQEKANANALMMTGATPVVPAGGPTNLNMGINMGRRKRDISAAVHILHLIETFQEQQKKHAVTK